MDWLFVPTGDTPEKEKESSVLCKTVKRSLGKPIRKSLAHKFPEIISEGTQFLKDNSYAAHHRRQNEIGQCGVSLTSIQTHLLEKVGNLKAVGISRSTIHRQMNAPNKRRISSKYYKNRISAKVACK